MKAGEFKTITEHTCYIFVKDKNGKEYHAHCPFNENVLMADDTCWKCKHNLRLSHDQTYPPFTIECALVHNKVKKVRRKVSEDLVDKKEKSNFVPSKEE